MQSPSPFPTVAISRDLAARVALGLTIGAIGGGIAHALHVPLAFMLGSLFACMAASIAGAPVDVPLKLRSAFMVLIGLFLGESFTVETADRIAAWPASIGLAIAYVPVAAWACYVFYARVARLDRLTALFSAIPGGLSAVVMFSGALGGDERRVALSQSLRISIVVVTAPAIAFGLLGHAKPDLAALAQQIVSWQEAGLLAAASAMAIWSLQRVGSPLPTLVGPMLASAVLRIFGIVEGTLPPWLVEVALVVLGSSIGCRFRGVALGSLLTLAGWTLLGTGLLMAIAAVFAVIAATTLDVDLIAALLAFAPGGVAEMCLIAIALDADPGFVATHHIARIMFILLATPVFAAWLKRGLAIDDP